MPRQPRHWQPNSVVHIISRFVDRAFRLTDEIERRRYLRNVSRAVGRSDWRPLAYALMSSHIHWVMLAGHSPPHRVLHPAHTGFAQWLNRRQGRLGPVFASRFSAIHVDGDDACALVAYVHNNPVRAGVALGAESTRWTSHRALVGLDPRPDWLDASTTLAVCGLRDDAEGRRELAAFVRSRGAEPRQGLWSARASIESVARRGLGTSHAFAQQIDTHPERGTCAVMVAVPSEARMRPAWPGDTITVIREVASACSLQPREIRSTSRQRHLVAGRRLALAVWTRHLGRSLTEMAAALGITVSAASQLLSNSDASVALLAEDVAERILNAWSPET